MRRWKSVLKQKLPPYVVSQIQSLLHQAKLVNLGVQAVIDRTRLFRYNPQLRPLTRHLGLNYRKLSPFYVSYVTTVSSPKMAVSLELAAFLLSFCQLVKPKRIADLGSGFSSFIFRHYAKKHKGVTVYSVDDNKIWLNKTVRYLNTHRLSTENIIMWPVFRQKQQFDLVLHDLSNMNFRAKTIRYAISLVKPGGYLICDDLHFPDYQQVVHREIKRIEGKFNSLRWFTKDKYGRYAAIFRRAE